MISRQSGALHWKEFSIFQDYPVVQGVFTRKGGTSPAPWDSLNLGGTVGDHPERVKENKRRLLGALGFEGGATYEVWQVHSARIVNAYEPLTNRAEIQKADGIITRSSGLLLLMRFADCVPIYLYDPVHSALGLVHAGWQGTARRAASAGVQAMRTHFSSNPRNILAGIGPSIGPDHYQVGRDVVKVFRENYGSDADRFFHGPKDLIKLNLWDANRLDLQQAGVEEIETAGICTACYQEDWFSHRGAEGRTGRFGAVFGLKDN